MTIGVMIPAAGSGSRFGGTVKKQFLELDGLPVVIRTILAFKQNEQIGHIMVVVSETEADAFKVLLEEHRLSDVVQIALGGNERYHSVYNGLLALPQHVTHVLIHDGARPFVSQAIIHRCVSAFDKWDGFITAIPAVDTIKRISEDGSVIETLDRRQLVQVQTPQGFLRETLMDAYGHINFEEQVVTDDAFIYERLGLPVHVVLGEVTNIKITTPLDLVIGQGCLASGGY